MHKYNNHFPEDATADSLTKDRELMLRGIFGSVGKAPFIEPPLNIDYGCNISVGDGFYSNFKCVFWLLTFTRILTRLLLHCGVLLYIQRRIEALTSISI